MALERQVADPQVAPEPHAGLHLGDVGVDVLAAERLGDRHPVVPSRTKYRSPTRYSEIGGSDSPRRWAAAIRSQRLRSRGDVGRKPRSKSAARSTVPTIASSGTIFRPRSSRPNARRVDDLLEREDQPDVVGLAPQPAADVGEQAGARAREKSPWASAAENPEDHSAHYAHAHRRSREDRHAVASSPKRGLDASARA